MRLAAGRAQEFKTNCQTIRWQFNAYNGNKGYQVLCWVIPGRLPSERAVEKLSESGGIGYPEAGLGGSDAYLNGQ
jgi:hypothetical protein